MLLFVLISGCSSACSCFPVNSIICDVSCGVLHGESITDQASPRTPTQRTFQPQEAVQPQRTKPYSKPTLPRERQTTPTNGHTPRRWKPTHTRLTYTRMRPHAPSHQAGDHPVPAHTERSTWHVVGALELAEHDSGMARKLVAFSLQLHSCIHDFRVDQ